MIKEIMHLGVKLTAMYATAVCRLFELCNENKKP